MSKVNRLLTKRLKAPKQTSKMTHMAQQSAQGNRTTFSGLFPVTELPTSEQEELEKLLHEFSREDKNISKDLIVLLTITAEVKAIDAQAAILHGERIKRAHDILTQYREGAFTAWLYSTYGNRQTPYNFYRYYLFYQMAPLSLRPLIEAMPRQAVYSLASREGDFAKKVELVERYQGGTKQEILQQIRSLFPLKREDRRQTDLGVQVLQQLTHVFHLLQREGRTIKKKHKEQIAHLLDAIDEEIFGTS